MSLTSACMMYGSPIPKHIPSTTMMVSGQLVLQWTFLFALTCCFVVTNKQQSFAFVPTTTISPTAACRTLPTRCPVVVRIPHHPVLPQSLGLQDPRSVFWNEKPSLPSKKRRSLQLPSSSSDNKTTADHLFDVRTTLSLIGGQSVVILAAALVAFFLKTPNFGFGSDISFDWLSIRHGTLLAMPLGLFAAALDLVEDRFPALQDVTKATQRSVLALLGGTWKPRIAIVTALALGLAAGVGEEMLFRGILQYELGTRIGDLLAVGLSSVIFGALHAVTPLYAGLATVASFYFGFLYLMTGNLAVPITCHAVYDVGALMFAHWTVSKLSDSERNAIAAWDGPNDSSVMW